MANTLTRLKQAVENADDDARTRLAIATSYRQQNPNQKNKPGFLAEIIIQMPNAATLATDIKESGSKETQEDYAKKAGNLAFAAAVATCAAITAAATITSTDALGIITGILIATLAGIITIIIAAATAAAYPGMQADARAAKLDATMPMALRHMSTQVRAGMPLDKSMESIARSDYGILSNEFANTVSDMRNGMPTEKAINDMMNRTRSKSLRKAGAQILRAMRTGGKLADIISQIASEASFEQSMKLRDFTEQLNIISVVFIMSAVVAPVVMTVLAAVTSVPMLAAPNGNSLMAMAFAASVTATIAIVAIITKLQPPTV